MYNGTDLYSSNTAQRLSISRDGKYIVPDAPTRLPNNGNQHTTHELTYTRETMSGLYNIGEVKYGVFPLSFNRIDFYQQEYSFITEKL